MSTALVLMDSAWFYLAFCLTVNLIRMKSTLQPVLLLSIGNLSAKVNHEKGFSTYDVDCLSLFKYRGIH